MEELWIRLATIGDLPEVALLHVRSWQAAYRGQLPDEYLDGLSVHDREIAWRSRMQNAAPRQELWVAERNEAIIGFASLGPSRDDDADDRWGEVYAVYLRPDCWDQGVGRELFAYASARLADLGFNRLVLWVLETNERARTFYERAGWHASAATKVDVRPGFEFREIRYELGVS